MLLKWDISHQSKSKSNVRFCICCHEILHILLHNTFREECRNKRFDFGEIVPRGTAPKMYLCLKNTSAIAAPYSVNIEHFTTRPPTPPEMRNTLAPKLKRSELIDQSDLVCWMFLIVLNKKICIYRPWLSISCGEGWNSLDIPDFSSSGHVMWT